MEQINKLPVLVIGAGIIPQESSYGRKLFLISLLGPCGLSIAHGLKRANTPVIVFERDVYIESRVKARDWVVGCYWSGPILAKLIGEEKWSRIQEAGIDPNMTVDDISNLPPVKCLHGVTGEPFAEMVTDGEPFFRFLRSRLISLLAEDIDVRYSQTIESFSCHKAPDGSRYVIAHFTDGTQVEGRLLIGADGAKSRVRSHLFGHDPEQAALTRLPYAATFVNSRFSTAEQAFHIREAQRHPFGCAIMHPSGLMNMLCILDAAQAKKPETWTFTFYMGTKSTIEEQDSKEMAPRERLLESKRLVRENGFGDPLKSVYEWVKDDAASVYYTKLANWDPSLPGHRWDNHDGLVTLAGDACHPMTYHRGQGLNHAIADAGKLVDLLTNSQDHGSLKEQIDAYEVEMIERGGQEVRLSELNTRMVHDWDRLMKSPLVTRGVRAK